MDTERKAQLDAFCQQAGVADFAITPLQADASMRSYFRLRMGDTHRILMNAPPDKGEDVRPFIAATDALREIGLSAPEIFARDIEGGFLLLEDLGPSVFAQDLAKSPQHEEIYYAAAIDLLFFLQKQEITGDFSPYSIDIYCQEAALATDWYIEAISDENRVDYQALIRCLCESLNMDHPCLTLRDYHAENLVWMSERNAQARVGLLDYQDALIGHPAYDLVSLLEDARRVTSVALQEAMFARFCEKSQLDPENLRRDYHILGAQRNLKIIGIFARLWLRDGKSHYLAMIPHVWSHLRRDLAHPFLSDLRDWVEAHLPFPDPAYLEALHQRGLT